MLRNRFVTFSMGLLCTLSLKAQAGDFCGSKEGYFNLLASTYLIPDSFPPQNELARLVSSRDRERCEAIGVVNLGQMCAEHDTCYEQRQPKDSCDSRLQDQWVRECRAVYSKLRADHITCRLACEAFVKIMSEAQRYDGNGICPSCDAYDALQ